VVTQGTLNWNTNDSIVSPQSLTLPNGDTTYCQGAIEATYDGNTLTKSALVHTFSPLTVTEETAYQAVALTSSDNTLIGLSKTYSITYFIDGMKDVAGAFKSTFSGTITYTDPCIDSFYASLTQTSQSSTSFTDAYSGVAQTFTLTPYTPSPSFCTV